jgi:hypothetical protein
MEIANHGSMVVETEGIRTTLYLDGDVQIAILTDGDRLDPELVRARWRTHLPELERRIASVRALALLIGRRARWLTGSASLFFSGRGAWRSYEAGAAIELALHALWLVATPLLVHAAFRLLVRAALIALKAWGSRLRPA